MRDDIGLDVLLLCGDSSLAEMYRLKFEMDGYRVTSLHRLDDWTLQHRPPDIVVLDLTYEGASSIADLERLRAHRMLRNVPLLLMSNRTTDELEQLGLALRPTDYLLRLAVPDSEHFVAQTTTVQPLAI